MDIAVARPEVVVEAAERQPDRSRWAIFLQLNFRIPATVLLLLVVAAIFAPQLAPYDPLKTSLTERLQPPAFAGGTEDRKSTRLNSSHSQISYAVFCLKKKKTHVKTFSSPVCDASMTIA